MKRKLTSSVKSSEPTKTPVDNRLYRSETNRVLGGVAGGLGEYLQVDPSLIRIGFILMTIFGGSGLLLYFILWLIVPTKTQSNSSVDYIQENVEELKSKTKELSASFGSQNTGTRYYVGLIILGIGVIFLLENFGFLPFLRMDRLWPLILVVIGLLVMSRK